MEQRIRENEEFVEPGAEHTRPELIRWHQDCSTMLQELGALKGKDQYIEMCLKLNADAQKWKFHFECGKQEQTKLVQEVNTLKTKLETVEGQLKVSLDSENNSREELEKMQQVAKFALMWGKALDAKGKLPAEQKVFLQMLQKQEAECLAPITLIPSTSDSSSSEIESIAPSSSENESASSPELRNRTQKKSKAADNNFLVQDLFGDSSSSESEREQESPRTTNKAMVKKPLSPLSCEFPPAAALLPVNECATRSSIRSLECDKSSSFYATPAKKTRTQSEEHHPSPFPTPAVDTSRLEEVILPCDPREGFKSPQSPDGVEEDDDEYDLIDISSSTGSTVSEIPTHQIQPEEEDEDQDELIYFSSSIGSTGSEIPELFSPLLVEETKSNCTFSWTAYNLPFSLSNQSTFGNPPVTDNLSSIGTSGDSSSSFPHSAPASGPLELPPVGHPSSVPEDSSTSEGDEEESTVAQKPPSQSSQKVAPAPTILPVRRKMPTQSSIPETAPIKAETQPKTVPSSGAKVAVEVQSELIHSPESSSSSDSLTMDLDPPHYNQVKNRITCASKRSFECETSASFYATPTKKTRTPSEEPNPSLFPRQTPAVDKSRVEDAVLPCDPREDFESPQSPEDAAPTENIVRLIPTNDGAQLSAFEIASEINRLYSSTCRVKPSHDLRNDTVSLDKFIKAPKMTAELLAETVDYVLQTDSVWHPSSLIQTMIKTITKAASLTPPSPPLAATQQRCITLLQTLDAKKVEIDAAKTDISPQVYSDVFLSEVSSFMFQMNSSLTLDGMCALAWTYIALARSRGLMDQARSFLYDCLYFFPLRSLTLAYTILSVWTEVLRHATLLTGLTAMDHTIAYLLSLECCKFRAVPGEEAQQCPRVKFFIEATLRSKNPSFISSDDLIFFLVSQLNKTRSVEEASSIRCSFLLLARWEGVDLAIDIIEKHLWPFLQKWKRGDASNVSAASAIKSIGELGKSVPTVKRDGVKHILGVIKNILVSEEADTIVEEAAAETVILLGEEEEPNTVVDVLKNWKPQCKLSAQLQKLMCVFLRRQSAQND